MLRGRQQLSAKGHDAGAADGQWGPQTERALKDFQEAQGIEPSGELDERTLSALGVEGAAAGATAGEGGAAAGETSGAPSGESEPARSN
jgi:peptidoglycan hydrolase-like protein with peptidoglycan-binding domain